MAVESQMGLTDRMDPRPPDQAHDRAGLKGDRVKAQTWLGVRLALTATMLAIVLPRLHPRSLVPTHHVQALLWIGGALLASAVAVVLSMVRWQQMLRALELPTRLPSLVSHTLAGLFVSNFLPTTVGGDVLRVARLSADNGHRKISAASVFLERLTGLAGLPLISLIALLLNPRLLRLGSASHLAVALSVGALGALALFLVVAAHPRLGERLGGRRRLAPAMTVHLGVLRLRRHPALAGAVMAAVLAYQVTMVLVAWLAAHALGMSLGWTAMMAFMPVVAIAQALPLSIGGLGLREGALVVLLGPLGVAASQAVALGLLLYAVGITVSLFGAPAFLVGSRRVVLPAPATAAA